MSLYKKYGNKDKVVNFMFAQKKNKGKKRLRDAEYYVRKRKCTKRMGWR